MAAPVASGAPVSEPRHTALVIDDSPAMRRHLVAALLRVPGVACAEAVDGVDGLRRASDARYDLVLTDINMPLLDGLKVIAALRARPEYAAVPIVVVTTESAEADRRRAMELGASAYLVKPVQAQAVIDTARLLLQL